MTRAEKYARVYAAWLLIYSSDPKDLDRDEWQDGVGAALDLLLEDAGLDVCSIYQDWNYNVATHGLWKDQP